MLSFEAGFRIALYFNKDGVLGYHLYDGTLFSDHQLYAQKCLILLQLPRGRGQALFSLSPSTVVSGYMGCYFWVNFSAGLIFTSLGKQLLGWFFFSFPWLGGFSLANRSSTFFVVFSLSSPGSLRGGSSQSKSQKD